jgi:C-terminal processing protease CtpA/Prc
VVRCRTGDVLVSINDKSVENVYHADVVDALKKAGNTVRLVRSTLYSSSVFKRGALKI